MKIIPSSIVFVAFALLQVPILSVQAKEGGSLRRRVQDSTVPPLICKIGARHTTFVQTANETFEEEDIVCIPVEVDGRPSPFEYVIDLPEDIVDEYDDLIFQGKLYVSIQGATLVDDEEVLLSPDAEFTILENGPPTTTMAASFAATAKVSAKDNRDATGTRTLIAFRINGKGSDPQVVDSAAKIHDALFSNGVSVSTQFNKCSVGILSWKSAGVHDVFLPQPLSAYSSVDKARNAAISVIKDSPSFKQMHGNQDWRDVAHNTMFIMPPKNWGRPFIATGVTGGTITTVSFPTCTVCIVAEAAAATNPHFHVLASSHCTVFGQMGR